MLKKAKYQIAFKMRKIINSFKLASWIILSICVTSCNNGSKNDSADKKVDSLPAINNIIAIGKVVPADGWVKISSPINGIIDEIMVKEGDEVKNGQVLFRLKENTAGIDVSQAQAQLENLQASRQANQKELEKEEILLAELKSKYETSQKLFDRNAETKETVETDLSNYKQQIQKIASLRDQLKANRLSEKEQSLLVEKSKNELNDYTVIAPENGIITDLNVEVGQFVNGTDDLGNMIDNTKSVVDAEVDELFADSVRIGQLVEITSVGKTNIIGKGKIIYVSPTLVNKSILFESANEAEDRRVRRIKIDPDSSTNLLINSKVECRILID